MEYKAGLDGAWGRPDAAVFLPAAVVHRDLPHPFQGEADNHQAAENLLGADRGAVPRVYPDMADAIPEDRLGLLVQKDEGVGKLAGHEPRLADAVPDRPGPASALFPERLAWGVLAQSWAPRHAAVAPYRQDAGRSAA